MFFGLLKLRIYDTDSPPSPRRRSRVPYIPSKEKKLVTDMLSYLFSAALWTSTSSCQSGSYSSPDVLGIVLVLYVLAWNTTNVKLPPTMPTSLQSFSNILMLDQVHTRNFR